MNGSFGAVADVVRCAGYIPQYLKIRRSKNAEGFSTLVSFALITSNTIRLFFW